MNLKFTGHKKLQYSENISLISFKNKSSAFIFINAEMLADVNSYRLNPYQNILLSYNGINEINLYSEKEADIDVVVMQALKTAHKKQINTIPSKIDFGGIANQILVNNISGDVVHFNLNSSYNETNCYSVESEQTLKISDAHIAYLTIVSDAISLVEILAGR